MVQFFKDYSIIIGALITAFIGAFATIIGAFISRGYISHRLKNPSNKIGAFSSMFLQFFSLFRVKNARIYKLKKDKAVIDDLTGLTITVTNFFLGMVDFTIYLPFSDSPIYQNIITPGWVFHFPKHATFYRFTLIEVVGDSCIIEIRELV